MKERAAYVTAAACRPAWSSVRASDHAPSSRLHAANSYRPSASRLCPRRALWLESTVLRHWPTHTVSAFSPRPLRTSLWRPGRLDGNEVAHDPAVVVGVDCQRFPGGLMRRRFEWRTTVGVAVCLRSVSTVCMSESTKTQPGPRRQAPHRSMAPHPADRRIRTFQRWQQDFEPGCHDPSRRRESQMSMADASGDLLEDMTARRPCDHHSHAHAVRDQGMRYPPASATRLAEPRRPHGYGRSERTLVTMDVRWFGAIARKHEEHNTPHTSGAPPRVGSGRVRASGVVSPLSTSNSMNDCRTASKAWSHTRADSVRQSPGVTLAGL